MPLIMIHAFAPADATVIPRMIIDVRDAGAAAFACERSNIWVLFSAIAPGSYVQGEGAPGTAHEAASHPPVVIVKAQAGRSDAERERLVKAVSDVVGRALGIPAENVWIQYEVMRPQDVWFGGRWAG